jgi:hypothetical protein
MSKQGKEIRLTERINLLNGLLGILPKDKNKVAVKDLEEVYKKMIQRYSEEISKLKSNDEKEESTTSEVISAEGLSKEAHTELIMNLVSSANELRTSVEKARKGLYHSAPIIEHDKLYVLSKEMKDVVNKRKTLDGILATFLENIYIEDIKEIRAVPAGKGCASVDIRFTSKNRD